MAGDGRRGRAKVLQKQDGRNSSPLPFSSHMGGEWGVGCHTMAASLLPLCTPLLHSPIFYSTSFSWPAYGPFCLHILRPAELHRVGCEVHVAVLFLEDSKKSSRKISNCDDKEEQSAAAAPSHFIKKTPQKLKVIKLFFKVNDSEVSATCKDCHILG